MVNCRPWITGPVPFASYFPTRRKPGFAHGIVLRQISTCGSWIRSTLMPTDPAVVPSPEDLQKKADSYVKILEKAFQNSQVNNYWRCGNAASTLLDYFHLGGKITSADFIAQKHQWFIRKFPSWFDGTGNLWFDDYLWWTIAALKNASSSGPNAPWDEIF